MTSDSPLMKKLLSLLAKTILVPLGLTGAASGSRCSYSKRSFWMRHYRVNNFKWRKGWCNKKLVKSFEESELLTKGVINEAK